MVNESTKFETQEKEMQHKFTAMCRAKKRRVFARKPYIENDY